MVTCKDCLHNHVCALWRAQEGQDAKSWSDSDDWDCDYFADKSRFVELPCKVGDVVYCLVRKDEIIECRVYSFEQTMYSAPQIWLTLEHEDRFGVICQYNRNENSVGKTVFLTREEAEAALAERMKENG